MKKIKLMTIGLISVLFLGIIMQFNGIIIDDVNDFQGNNTFEYSTLTYIEDFEWGAVNAPTNTLLNQWQEFLTYKRSPRHSCRGQHRKSHIPLKPYLLDSNEIRFR
jgi:hypothetical protein